MTEEIQKPSLRKRLAAYALILLLICLIESCASITYRTMRLYIQLKSAGRGWTNPVNKFDPVYGYRPLADVSSADMFPCGLRVPVFLGSDGIRQDKPERSISTERRPIVLSLGCSFTFGTGCLEEETFTNLAAEGLHGEAINAGVAGYGLAQMSLRAHDLVPKYKPDYVLLQYAPWLISRSIGYYGVQEAHGRTPRPFFTVDKEGKYSVATPVFGTNYFNLHMSDYVEGKSNVLDFSSFLVRVGVPLWTYSDWQNVLLFTRNVFGILPEQAKDSNELVKSVYSDLVELCQGNGSKAVIVAVDSGGILPENMSKTYLDALRSIPGVIFVDAYSEMYNRLSERSPEAYEKAYGIWACEPSRLIDRHPNPAAHKVIAETILNALKQ
jgi:hypothetical protein